GALCGSSRPEREIGVPRGGGAGRAGSPCAIRRGPYPPDPVSAPLPFDPIDEARRQWRRHWGGSAVPSMAAVTSIMRAEQILIARLNDLLKPWELTFPRYEALMLLFYSRNGSLPLGKIGERLQVHRTSITNTVDGLEKLRYVNRSPHESDRRSSLAEITDRGR